MSVLGESGRSGGGHQPHPAAQRGQRGELPGVRSPVGVDRPHVAVAPALGRGWGEAHRHRRPSQLPPLPQVNALEYVGFGCRTGREVYSLANIEILVYVYVINIFNRKYKFSYSRYDYYILGLSIHKISLNLNLFLTKLLAV